jgi:hypothetical protein
MPFGLKESKIALQLNFGSGADHLRRLAQKNENSFLGLNY